MFGLWLAFVNGGAADMLPRRFLKSLTVLMLACCLAPATLRPAAENTTQLCVRFATQPPAPGHGLDRPPASSVQTSERQTTVYQGTINGNVAIGLALVQDSGKQFYGWFFYRRDLKDFDIQGEAVAGQKFAFTLRQLDARGTVIGTFQLHSHSDEAHPDQAGNFFPQTLEGVWTDAEHRRTYPVALTMQHQSMVAENEPALERNAQAFYFALLQGNKKKAARHVHYPLRIYVAGEKSARNPSEFLRDYDRIFTADYLACLQQDVPHHMFHRNGQAMIAGGALWFDQRGYAITVNNCRR